jgi:hypothetical protein
MNFTPPFDFPDFAAMITTEERKVISCFYYSYYYRGSRDRSP